MLDHIETPLGPMSREQFKTLYDLKVWTWNPKDNQVVLLSEEVETPKKGEKIWLPVRYYNMLWALHETKDNFNEAVKLLKIYGSDYMPSAKGFTSYSAMINAIGQKLRS